MRGGGGAGDGQRRGERWRRQYIDPVTRRSRSKTFGSEADARAFGKRLSTLRDDLRAGRISPDQAARELAPLVGKASVAEVWKAYVAGVSAASRPIAEGAWKNRLGPQLGALQWWELDAERMRAWQIRMREAGYGQKTIVDSYHWLSAAYHLAMQTGRVDSVPWRLWRPDTAQKAERPCIASLDELVALVVCARADDEKEWLRGRPSYLATAVLVLHLTGMRQSEACGLAWDRLTLDTDPTLIRIFVQAPPRWRRRPENKGQERPKTPPKSGKPRTQILHPSAAVALRELREHLRGHGLYHESGAVFPPLRGREKGKWRNGILLKPAYMRSLARLAGLRSPDEWVTHSSRHGFASLEALCIVQQGGDLEYVKQRTGHSSIRQLEDYLHRMGHGVARSGIPELPQGLASPALPTAGEDVTRPRLPEPPPALTEAPLVDLAKATADAAHACERRRANAVKDARAAERARDSAARPFAELARQWTRAPDGRRARPDEVTRAAKRAYARAYNRARRDGQSERDSAKAGAKARHSCLGAWRAALGRAARELR